MKLETKLYRAQLRENYDPTVLSPDEIKAQLEKKFGPPSMQIITDESATYLVWGGHIPRVFFDPSTGPQFEALTLSIERGSYTLTLNSPKLAAQAAKCQQEAAAASKQNATSSLRF